MHGSLSVHLELELHPNYSKAACLSPTLIPLSERDFRPGWPQVIGGFVVSEAPPVRPVSYHSVRGKDRLPCRRTVCTTYRSMKNLVNSLRYPVRFLATQPKEI